MNIEPRTSNLASRTRAAWRMASVLGVLAIGLALSSGAQQTNTHSAAATTSDSLAPSLNAFSIIPQRNIFDPNRRPYIRTGGTGVRPPRIDAFALKGTMSYAKGRFAFFDGTSSEYNKVLAVGGNIAGYTVAEITPDGVMLSAKGKEFRMPVGKQVRNQNGTWQMGQAVDSGNDETNSDETATTADSSTPPPAANAQASEILKRLMQAKEQELKDIK